MLSDFIDSKGQIISTDTITCESIWNWHLEDSKILSPFYLVYTVEGNREEIVKP